MKDWSGDGPARLRLIREGRDDKCERLGSISIGLYDHLMQRVPGPADRLRRRAGDPARRSERRNGWSS